MSGLRVRRPEPEFGPQYVVELWHDVGDYGYQPWSAHHLAVEEVGIAFFPPDTGASVVFTDQPLAEAAMRRYEKMTWRIHSRCKRCFSFHCRTVSF